MLNRCVTVFNNLFAIWVLLGGLAAWFFPDVFLAMKGGMEYFFGLTMFGIGMTLHLRDFKHIFLHFWQVAVGVAAQFSIMPLLAFGIAHLFQFNDDFTLGLILTGSAPGAMASNTLSYLAGADVAYSISLTTCSTLLAPVMTPFLTWLLAREILDVPFLDMMWSVCKMIVLPLMAGFVITHFFENQVRPIKKIFPAISTTFIVFICAVVIAANKNYLMEINAWIFAAAVLLNLLGLAGGYLVGFFCRFDLLKKRALAIEIGMQNAGLGSVLAVKYYNERVAIPAVIFVFICIFSASILVPLWSRSSRNMCVDAARAR